MTVDRRRLAGLAHVGLSAAALLAAPAITRGGVVATAVYVGLVAASLAYGLAWLVRPGAVAERFRARGLDPVWPTVVVAGLLLVDVLAVLGTPVVYAIGSLELRLAGVATPGYRPVVPSIPELLVRRIVNLSFWCGPILVFLFVAGTGDLGDVREKLGLTGGPREVALGLAWTVPTFLVLVGIAKVIASVGVAGGGGQTASIVHALLVAVTAGVGEEIFFRGFLQPRIGLLPQAVWFGVEHASYLSITAMVGALAAGIIFGLEYRRTGSLYVPIVAHVAYDVLVIVGV